MFIANTDDNVLFQLYSMCASRFIFERVKSLEITLKRLNNVFHGFVSVLFQVMGKSKS